MSLWSPDHSMDLASLGCEEVCCLVRHHRPLSGGAGPEDPLPRDVQLGAVAGNTQTTKRLALLEQ